MATAPRPGAARRKEAENASITVKVDDAAYTMRMAEISARDTGDLRRATGMSVAEVMVCAQESPDLDVAAALIWLARRQNGEPKLPYDDVAGDLTYGSDFDLEEDSEADDEDSPEA